MYPPQPLPLNGAEYSAHVDDVRASQIIRGSLRTKIVASPEALRSLESVSVSELPENEKGKFSFFFLLRLSLPRFLFFFFSSAFPPPLARPVSC